MLHTAWPGAPFCSCRGLASARCLQKPCVHQEHVRFQTEGWGRCSCHHPASPAVPGTEFPAVAQGRQSYFGGHKKGLSCHSVLAAGFHRYRGRSWWLPELLGCSTPCSLEGCDMCPPQCVRAAVPESQCATGNSDCCGLNCVLENSYIQVFTPKTSEGDLMWRQGHCRCN